LKSKARTLRISWSGPIIEWQDYRVFASRLAESNFRYTQVVALASAVATLIAVNYRCAYLILHPQQNLGGFGRKCAGNH
jgi:hypothetical protein